MLYLLGTSLLSYLIYKQYMNRYMLQLITHFLCYEIVKDENQLHAI